MNHNVFVVEGKVLCPKIQDEIQRGFGRNLVCQRIEENTRLFKIRECEYSIQKKRILHIVESFQSTGQPLSYRLCGRNTQYGMS